MSVGSARQNIIILFWKKGGCRVSFLGIHKWEPDIYIGFSPSLHLQRSRGHQGFQNLNLVGFVIFLDPDPTYTGMATTRVAVRVFQNRNLAGFGTFLDPDTNYGLLLVRSKIIF
jgi:hypothetical protein